MENIYEEALIKESLPPKPLKESKLKDMINKICRISVGKKIGTGFFCEINYKNKLIPVLITNYHIINDNILENEKQINIYINDYCKQINIDKNRKIYSSKNDEYDIMIIKLKEEDGIKDYLKIDPNIFDDNWENIYKKELIHVLHYPSSEAMISTSDLGIVKKDEYTILHKCNTENGSSGGPIINGVNYKVLGIHKGSLAQKNDEIITNTSNIGILLRYPLAKLNEQNSKENEEILIEDESLIKSKSSLISNNDIIEDYIINEMNEIKILEKLPISNDNNLSYLLLGDSNSGKNDFLNKLDEYIKYKKFQKRKSSINFNPERVISIKFKNKIYSIQFIDCSGKFKLVSKYYYHFSNSYVIFFNISENKSFDNAKNWIDDIYSYNKKAKMILIGNKNLNEINTEENYKKAKNFAKENKIKFYEISNVSENNIKQILFDSLKRENKIDEDKKIRLVDNLGSKKKIRCF